MRFREAERKATSMLAERQHEQILSSERGELTGKEHMCCLHLPDTCSRRGGWKLLAKKLPFPAGPGVGGMETWNCHGHHREGPA